MNRIFIFMHGWGFDKTFWQNLAPFFKNEQCIFLDSGYFGEMITLRNLSDNCSYIAIGHSLGFSKLLCSKIKFEYLVGLNSFLNFLGNEIQLKSSRQKELNLLKQCLMHNCSLTLNNFYKRCAVQPDNNKFAKADIALLKRDLDFLELTYLPRIQTPILILNGQYDIIMPKVLSNDNFGKYSNIKLEMLNANHHGFGYFNAKLVYNRVMNFINADIQTKNYS